MEEEELVAGPDCGLTPGQARLTVGRKITFPFNFEICVQCTYWLFGEITVWNRTEELTSASVSI
jgi:hypothetical protein